MALANEIFGSAGNTIIPGIGLQVNQIPQVAIGIFGLFLYLGYAARQNQKVGDVKDAGIGMFIIFAFLLDLFYLNDVWLITILGSLAGVYSLLGFAGVFGLMRQAGKLGYAAAEKVQGKRTEWKEEKEVQKNEDIADLTAEVQEEKEESNILGQLVPVVNQINAKKSYFFNFAQAGQSIQALARVKIYFAQLTKLFELQQKAAAQLEKKAEAIGGAKAKEVKEAALGKDAGQMEAAGEQQQIQELVMASRLLPMQQREQIRKAIVGLQQAEVAGRQEATAEQQEEIEERTLGEEIKMQARLAGQLVPVYKRLAKASKSIESNIAKVDAAMQSGKAVKQQQAIAKYPTTAFNTAFEALLLQHKQIGTMALRQQTALEIRIVSAEINSLVRGTTEEAHEMRTDTLLAQAEQIKSSIDAAIAAKGDAKSKDARALGMILKEAGATQQKGMYEAQVLQQLKTKLMRLQQLNAMLATAQQ